MCVQQVAALPQDVPPPQDTTEVAAVLDRLWDENCVLVDATRHELSVQIPQEQHDEEEAVHYTPQLTRGNMCATDLYRCEVSYGNSGDEICRYMADVVVAPEEVTDIEQKTRDPNRDQPLWKCMRALRISAGSKAHTVLRTRKEHNVLAEGFMTERSFWSETTAYGTALESEAILAFCEQMSSEVQRCGLYIMLEQSWLWCTPDGLPCTQGA